MSALFTNATVDIKRKVKASVSDLGTPVYRVITVITELQCCLQRDSSIIVYGIQGQTVVSDYTLTCRDELDIRSNDIVYDQTGQVYTVIGKPYQGIVIHHLEVALKLGVTD